MFNIRNQEAKKPRYTPDKIAWICIFVLLAVFVAIPRLYMPVSWLMFVCLVVLFFYDDFYIAGSVFLFFEDNLVVIPGVGLFALYSFMLIAKFFIFDKCEKKIPVPHIPAVLVIVLYGLFAVSNADTSTAVSTYLAKGMEPPPDIIINMRLLIGFFLNIIVIYVMAIKIRQDRAMLRSLFTVIVITAVFSGIYGFVDHNIFYYGSEDSGILRYMGSFNDPNYASFFFNLSIFAIYILNLFDKKYIKIPVLAALYYFLLASGSLSGIGFHVIGLSIYAVLKYRQRAIITLAVISIIGAAGLVVVLKVPAVRNIPVFQSLSTRLERQFVSGDDTSLSGATSGRAAQWQKYWGHFKGQDVVQKLFGGNVILSYSIDPQFTEKYGNAPHQAYLSFLLDFGIIGTVFFLGAYIGKVGIVIYDVLKNHFDTDILLLFSSIMWMFYGLGFDYLGDWRFMFFYFL